MKKYLLVSSLALLCAVVQAQAIISRENVKVEHSDCVEATEGSGTGAALGGAAGVGAASLFTRHPLGWAIGGLVGGAIGNSAGSKTMYTCQVQVKGAKGDFMTQYQGTNKPRAGETRVLNVLTTGQGVLQ